MGKMVFFGIWFVFVLTLFSGWVINIITIANTDNILSTGVGILRIVGIFIGPLGSIMGLFVN